MWNQVCYSVLYSLTVLPTCLATVVTNNDPNDLLAYKSQCVTNITDYPSESGPPTRYGMLLFRGFEILDVNGPLDVLSSLSLKTPLSLALIAETMDSVTSKPQMALPINSSVWSTIVPTHTFATAPDIEVPFVPGGPGTRAPTSQLNNTFAWLETTYPMLRYLVTVCTGSLLVSRTTILNGRNATTNKLAFKSVAANNTAVNWFPAARWVVDDNIWTASGVTAGIDAAFAFAECFFGGELAESVADFIEYTRHEDPREDPFAIHFDTTAV